MIATVKSTKFLNQLFGNGGTAFQKSQQKQVSSFIKILPVTIEQHSTIEIKIGSAVICIKEGCSEKTVKMVLNAAKSIYSDPGVANYAS